MTIIATMTNASADGHWASEALDIEGEGREVQKVGAVGTGRASRVCLAPVARLNVQWHMIPEGWG